MDSEGHERSRDDAARTIPEFCVEVGISRSHFYALAGRGLAPRTFRLGRSRYVAADEMRSWRRLVEEGLLSDPGYDESDPGGFDGIEAYGERVAGLATLKLRRLRAYRALLSDDVGPPQLLVALDALDGQLAHIEDVIDAAITHADEPEGYAARRLELVVVALRAAELAQAGVDGILDHLIGNADGLVAPAAGSAVLGVGLSGIGG